MYTVLFVDDESSVIETLKTNIHWQQFGIDTILSAPDGLQALALFSAHKINLLITDIKMPHMTGLELLQKVRSKYPETRCILLSAYSDFEYAKEGIQLGVENYLLKPLQIEEMNETIEKAIDNIYNNHANTRSIFYESILLRWTTGNINSEELAERAAILNINIYLPYYCIICIKKEKQFSAFPVFCTLCEESISRTQDVYHFSDNGKEVFIVGSNFDAGNETKKVLEQLTSEKNLQKSVKISIGPEVQDSNSLFRSYKTACRNLEHADGNSEYILSAEKNSYPSPETDILSEELLNLFQEKNTAMGDSKYTVFLRRILTSTKTKTVQSQANLFSDSLQELFSKQFPNQAKIQELLSSRIQIFLSLANEEEISDAAIELLEYSRLLYQYHFKQFSIIIQEAITYIHTYYADGLSIKEFCVERKVNPSYLGYLFKKETGMFFNNYLLQYRISRASYLLKSTDIKISDIAKQIGFTSTSYFISCFRQQTSLSPEKYRMIELNTI